jgi:hypothetical protein
MQNNIRSALRARTRAISNSRPPSRTTSRFGRLLKDRY